MRMSTHIATYGTEDVIYEPPRRILGVDLAAEYCFLKFFDHDDSVPARRRSASRGGCPVPTPAACEDTVSAAAISPGTVGVAVPLLVVGNSGSDPADSFGVGDSVDLHDSAVSDGETDYGDGTSVRDHQYSGGSVHQRLAQLYASQDGRKPSECLLGDGR